MSDEMWLALRLAVAVTLAAWGGCSLQRRKTSTWVNVGIYFLAIALSTMNFYSAIGDAKKVFTAE